MGKDIRTSVAAAAAAAAAHPMQVHEVGMAVGAAVQQADLPPRRRQQLWAGAYRGQGRSEAEVARAQLVCRAVTCPNCSKRQNAAPDPSLFC